MTHSMCCPVSYREHRRNDGKDEEGHLVGDVNIEDGNSREVLLCAVQVLLRVPPRPPEKQRTGCVNTATMVGL